MNNISSFITQIDWIFLAVILIGGRYWGSKYFTISKSKARNFLAFSTVFGLIWLPLNYHSWALIGEHAPALFLTYLFGTSFYELIAKKLFEVIEGLFGKPVMASGDNGSREAIWFEKFSDFPQQGDETKLYYDASTDEYYYWTGTMYARWVGPRPPKPPKPPL